MKKLMLSLLVVSLIGCASKHAVLPQGKPKQEKAIVDDLEGFYRFYDKSTVYGTTNSVGHDGKQKGAYCFNGKGDWIKFESPEILNFDIEDSYSFSFWLKVPRMMVPEMGIIEKWIGQFHQPYPIAVRMFDGRLWFAIYQTGLGYFVADSVRTQRRIDDDRWTHVVCTKNGVESMKLYVNGELEDSNNNLLQRTIRNNHYYMIGNNWNKYLKGCLDDLRIYNRALDDSEVKKLFRL